MILDYVGVKEINGSLIVLDDVEDAFFEEMVDIRLDNGTIRHGRIVQIEGKRVVVQVFEGTKSISLDNTRTRLKARPMELALSPTRSTASARSIPKREQISTAHR